MLRAAEQHVAARHTLDPCAEATSTVQPDDAPPVLGAALEEGGGDSDLSEHDDRADPNQGRSEAQLALDLHSDGVVIEPEHGVLGLDIEDIEQLTHLLLPQPISSGAVVASRG